MATQDAYKVLAIERSREPKVAAKGDWYRYTIANKTTRVTGRRCGTREEVRAHAEHVATRLTLRRNNGHSIWAPRGRKAKPKPA